MTRLLDCTGIKAGYGDFQALFGIDAHVDEGECIAFIGANGAGKSTLMRTIVGQITPTNGAIVFDGTPIQGLSAPEILTHGVAMVPEGRRLFSSLTVEENLLIGNYSGRQGAWTLDRIYSLFPVLQERRKQAATSLSGGQQQMVAIGRALMSNPRLLLCDEISLGLAPVIIRDIYGIVPQIRSEGTAILVVEQDIGQALAVADRIYCLQEGRISLTGKPESLSREEIRQAYFGTGPAA